MNGELELQAYLKKAGVEPAATRVYLKLNKEGPCSALQLAKTTGVSRTQVYRYLEALQAIGLVSAEQLSYGTLFRALPLESLEGLITDKETEAAELRGQLADMSRLLQHLAGSNGPKATVQHFYGIAGLKQANWNLTKANKEYRVFEAAHLHQHLDKTFAKRHRECVLEKQIYSYDLTNAERTTAAELEPFNPAMCELRHIDPQVLHINFEMYIYNHVVTLLDYSKENAMAMEIHHPALHAMMRQLFDAMWQLGTPITVE
ncbi:MAG TPA: helix-turn-helix domain-containing protein [Candidatus Saccharimonadales bacterium]|nr:helix-turn-helix domain-containing protein [Candidatus Saccharimonadales bacterium]